MTRLAKRLGLDGYDSVRELYAGAVRAGTLGFAGKAGVQVEAQALHGERALAAEMASMLSRQIAALAEPAALDRWPMRPRACTRRGASIASACARATRPPGTSTTCCRFSATRR
jgi:hypothetical protein